MKPPHRTIASICSALLPAAACLLTAQAAPAAAPPAAPVFGPAGPSATDFSPTAAPSSDTVRETASPRPHAPAFAAAPSSESIGPRPGVVLLRNGEVLAGRIAQVGDYYEVLLPNGRIRLRAAEVEMACADLEEGYQRKRAAIRPDDAREHLRLAWWCMHHDLLGHAAAELADATQLDPEDPLIEPVKRRLELALTPPADSSTPGAAAETAESAQSAQSAETAESGPTLEELDRTVRELPPGTVGEFRQVIQPMLWNSCASGQCHGAQGSKTFRLLRAPHGHVATRRLTQRNLHSVLSQINLAHPAQSPLLRAARTAHGPADQRVIAPADATQYRMLATWVARLTAGDGQVHQAAVTADSTADSHALPAAQGAQAAVFTAPIGGPAGQATAAGPSGSSSTPDGQSTLGPAAVAEPPQAGAAAEQTYRRQSNVQYGARLEVFEPVDPFDPEIFNRRYFPDARDTTDSTDSTGACVPGGLPDTISVRPHLVPSNPGRLETTRPTPASEQPLTSQPTPLSVRPGAPQPAPLPAQSAPSPARSGAPPVWQPRPQQPMPE